MSRSLGFGSNISGSHDPAMHGLARVHGQVYVKDGIYYVRQPEQVCPKHYRTGKPSYETTYAGLDDAFELEHLKAIVKHMEKNACRANIT
jgi:hypothetical protein